MDFQASKYIGCNSNKTWLLVSSPALSLPCTSLQSCPTCTGYQSISGFNTNCCFSHTVLSMDLLPHISLNFFNITIHHAQVFVLLQKDCLLNQNHPGRGGIEHSQLLLLGCGTHSLTISVHHRLLNLSNQSSKLTSYRLLMISIMCCYFYFVSCICIANVIFAVAYVFSVYLHFFLLVALSAP